MLKDKVAVIYGGGGAIGGAAARAFGSEVTASSGRSSAEFARNPIRETEADDTPVELARRPRAAAPSPLSTVQRAYRFRNHSTVRRTASGCGVGSNGPNAPWNFEASETNGRSNW
jgi:NAD(P)-dependent dehydrogenase (short-subunit alcohol dehydrogenase family)